MNSVAQHAGSSVVFCGTPTGIKCAEPGGAEPVYIDFGGAYPLESFSILLPANAARVGCAQLSARYMDHTLRVEGRVDMIAGKPVITLDDADRIVIDTR